MSSDKRLRFLMRQPAEITALLDLRGQFLDPRDNPLLFRQRRKRDFDTEELLGLDPVLSASSSRFLITLRPEVPCFGEPVHPARVESVGPRREHWELTRTVTSGEGCRHDSDTTIPCPNFVYDEVARFSAK